MRAAALVAALSTASCGVAMDGYYLARRPRMHETITETAPSGQAQTSLDFIGGLGPDGTMQVRCAERTRPVERAWFVDKTYRYRGGFTALPYASAAIGELLIGGLIATVILAACNQDDLANPVACSNVWYAAPLLVDGAYSGVRAAMARTPVLTGRHEHGEHLQLGAPGAEVPVPCPTDVTFAVGALRGPSDEDRLVYGSTEPRSLDDERTVGPGVRTDAGVALDLVAAPPALAAWASEGWVGLWAKTSDGDIRPVDAPRCPITRALTPRLTGEARQWFPPTLEAQAAQLCPAPAAPPP